jgi:hypothetical protein
VRAGSSRQPVAGARARVCEAAAIVSFRPIALGHDRVGARVLEGFELRGRAAIVVGATKMTASAKVRSPQNALAPRRH